MNTFMNWYRQYQIEITWFVIGWLALASVYDIANGNWLSLIINLALIMFNYKISKQ